MEVRDRTTLPATVDTPAAARAFARGVVERSGSGVRCEDVALVVSELVTNAVVHGDGEITLCVNVADDGVDVEVADTASSLPREMHPSMEAEGGRGLLLVSNLVQQWGVRPEQPGKVVWAHLQS